jgi:hypothetical protein
MPRPRLGPRPMTAAERQARRRAKLRQHASTAAPAPRSLPRPRRWAIAVAALLALQDEYRAWLDSIPEGLQDSCTAEKLREITELDLEELSAIDPPRGYGRD